MTEGVTLALPLTATPPTVGLIEAETAPDVVQLSVLGFGVVIDGGLAVKEFMAGAAAATVTVT